MSTIQSEIVNLLKVFDFPRVNKKDKLRSQILLKTMLEKNNYRVTISDGKNKNIETVCEDPEYIITAHYDGPFIIWRNYLHALIKFSKYKVSIVTAYVATAFSLMGLGFWLLSQHINTFSGLLLIFLSAIAPYFGLIAKLSSNVYGADDNTSGMIATLILAQELSPFQNNIKFVFFDNEEKGLWGSKSFDKNKMNKKRHKIINLDCVGRGKTLVIAAKPSNSPKDHLKQNFIGFLKEKNVKVIQINNAKSDSKSFTEEGFQAFTIQRQDLFGEKPVMWWPHTIEDKSDYINPVFIEEIILLIKGFIMTNSKSI